MIEIALVDAPTRFEAAIPAAASGDDRLRTCVQTLSETKPSAVASIRSVFRRKASGCADESSLKLAVCMSVLCDLRAQGWNMRVTSEGVRLGPPNDAGNAPAEKRTRIRLGHMMDRDIQIGQSSTRRFIQEMERRRLHNGSWHSIFSLMRDGRKLAAALQSCLHVPVDADVTDQLRQCIDPYIEVVEPGKRCLHTGLLISDVWRYFRHTWSTTYRSTPGRQLSFLVRDRAGTNHPVIGIGALGSAVVQLACRDEWIGWSADKILARMVEDPTARWARWLHRSLRELLDGIYVSDLVAERVLRRRDLRNPSPDVIARLRQVAVSARDTHQLYPQHRQHKQASNNVRAVNWKEQARTNLFRFRRAQLLADLLEARRALNLAGCTKPTKPHIERALAHPPSRRAIRLIARKVKARHVGVDMMDITVCGAIAPYGPLLGGKLTALLMASPAVMRAYEKRYRGRCSVIASSIAGRPVVRRPKLVLLGTTSLYGVLPCQYSGLRIQAHLVGGQKGSYFQYVHLGQSEGYGSYHFSRETLKLMDLMLARSRDGRQVNSIFGEGVNPKLRKVRAALDYAGLPADLLLQHGSSREVFAIPLATNFRDILIGLGGRAASILPDDGETISGLIDFWHARLLAKRIRKPGVLDQVLAHSLSLPVTHGARVSASRLAE